jgi:hypothetical protein
LTKLSLNNRRPSSSGPILLWAVGVNGEGSSHVTFAFIKYLLARTDPQAKHVTVTYSARSKLDEHISEIASSIQNSNHAATVKFVRLPKESRGYILHFLVKLLFKPSNYFSSVVVLDDFPFRSSRTQVLYFHQSNLIHNNKLIWRIKRLAFRSLLSRSLTLYFQTQHISRDFSSHFGDYNSLCFLHSLE